MLVDCVKKSVRKVKYCAYVRQITEVAEDHKNASSQFSLLSNLKEVCLKPEFCSSVGLY